jgi:hypothetical protein
MAMSRTIMAIQRADDDITALGNRVSGDTADPLLRVLEGWAAELDRRPMPDLSVDDVLAAAGPGTGRTASRVATRSLALAVALTVSSTGVAAAVNGNPWAPIHFVVTHITTFGGPAEPTPPNLGLAAPESADKAGGDRGRQRSGDGKRVSRGHREEAPTRSVTESSTSGVTSKPATVQTNDGMPAHHHSALPVVDPVETPPHHKPTNPGGDPPAAPGQSPQPPTVPTPPDTSFPAPKPGTDPPPADTD